MTKKSVKRGIILKFLQQNKTVTINDLLSMPLVNNYYCNGSKHCGELLRTMEKAGIICRIKKGVYGIPDKPRNIGNHKIELVDENQQTLF